MKKLLLLALLTQLAACNFDDKQNKTSCNIHSDSNGALVRLVASDYSASDLGFVCENHQVRENLQPSAYSDIYYTMGEERLYQIGRYQLDYITSLSLTDFTTYNYQYSVNDIDTSGANPYTVVEASADKAYVIRYGANSIWQINPKAQNEVDFKEHEIDLSAFADADGKPEMADGVILNGVLYVILENLEFYDAVNPGTLIAIDTATNELIDLDDVADGINGLTLSITNPTSIRVLDSKLIVDGVGRYAAWDNSHAVEYTGGVISIDPANNYQQTTLYGNDSSTGQTSSIAINNTSMLFNQYFGYGNNKVFISENDVISELDSTNLTGDVTFVAISPENELWIGFNDNVSPKIFIYTKVNTTWEKSDEIETTLVPRDVIFVRH